MDYYIDLKADLFYKSAVRGITGFHLTSLRPCFCTLTKLLFGTPTWPLCLLSFVSPGIALFENQEYVHCMFPLKINCSVAGFQSLHFRKIWSSAYRS